MKRFITLFIATLALFVMAGCTSVPVEKVVYQTKYVVIQVESKYLEPTKFDPPPAIGTYAEGEVVDWEAEYNKLAKSNISIYSSLGSCNADKAGAKLDLSKKVKRYE